MKTVVITGATSGIGNLLVKAFVEEGCRVFAGYRNIKLKKELEKISENVVPFKIDMLKKWSIAEAVKFISEKTEKIDVLINAASCLIAGPMECLDVNKIKEQFEVNTFSHLEFTQGLFEKLEGGKIFNISSCASFGVYPFAAPYCSSKRSLDIIFNLMQIECRDRVKVISMKPGVVKTGLLEKTIELNKDIIEPEKKYQKECEGMMEKAKRDRGKGLDPQKVVDFIMKIDKLENPKPSYTIGTEAKVVEIMSHLPNNWINFIVKKILKKEMVF